MLNNHSNREVYIDAECIINRNYYEGIKEMVSCIICSGIIVDPSQCNSCENNFCKVCIMTWKVKSNNCPFKCQIITIKDSGRTIKNLLEKLQFTCPNKCDLEFSYDNLIKHFPNCKNRKILCSQCSQLITKNSESAEIENLRYLISELEEENLMLKDKLLGKDNEIKDFNTTLNDINDGIKRFSTLNVSGSNFVSQSLVMQNFQNLQNSQIAQSMNNLQANNNLNNNNSNNSNNNPGFKHSNSNSSMNSSNNKSDEETGLVDKCTHFKGNYKPIFACCSKAYPCFICHNAKEKHAYEFSNKVVCLLCSNIYSGTECNQCGAIQMYKKK